MTNGTAGGPADQPGRIDPAALPAGFTVETCITVSCRTCQRPYEDDEVGAVNFVDIDSAARVVTGGGWWITQEGAQCHDCAAAEACAALGHAWPDWALCGCHGRIPDHVQQMRYRTCASCGVQEERPAATTSGA